MTANLYRVIHPVNDIIVAAQFFSSVLGTEGERMFYANDSFGNPISIVDQTIVFTGT